MTDDLRIRAVRFESGAILPAAAEAAAADEALGFCDVRGFGELNWVELQPTAGGTRRLRGPLDLLGLQGRLRRAGDVVLSDWICTVSRETDNGIEVIGGRLVAAECSFAEVSLTPLTAVACESGKRPDDGPAATSSPVEARPEARPAASAPSPAAPAPAAAMFAEAIAESRRQEASAPDWDREDEVRPSRGDVVNHLQFGRCKVLRIDDDHVTLRKPDGRTVQLGLPVLSFRAVDTEGPGRAFDVRIRRP
jgi:predicted DNA-binding protein with PD1-like motif